MDMNCEILVLFTSKSLDHLMPFNHLHYRFQVPFNLNVTILCGKCKAFNLLRNGKLIILNYSNVPVYLHWKTISLLETVPFYLIPTYEGFSVP